MIVLYLKSNGQFLQAIPGFPQSKEEDNKLLMKIGGYWRPVINDLTKAGYSQYPDQRIEWPMIEEDGEIIQKPRATLSEFHLRDFTQEELLERQKLSRDLYAEMDEVRREIAKVKKT